MFPMNKRSTDVVSTAVADPKSDDYVDLLEVSSGPERKLLFVRSGRSALSLGFAERWIINVYLPDMSGFDLCKTIKSRFPEVRMMLVDETYRLEHELLARSCCGAMYACKPLPAEWFSDWW
jgi:DNA-binding response OmpR family regulator